MSNHENSNLSLDILRHIEVLSEQINNKMARGTGPVFKRYPLTFALLILVGVVAVSEGVKGILVDFEFFTNHPWRLVIIGLVILVATGRLYKKLDKS